MAAENILVIATSSMRPDNAVRNIPANSNLRFTDISTDFSGAVKLVCCYQAYFKTL
jgi:hypothetical protein